MSDDYEAMQRLMAVPPPKIDLGTIPGLVRPGPTPQESLLASEALADESLGGEVHADTLVNLIGLWTSGMILRDIWHEPPSSEPEEEKKRTRKKQD